MITLINNGLIELDLITTMGTNVKVTNNAIGRFGTGLKYAIAILLREGIDFDLHIGENKYEFYTVEKEIRGKVFNICHMRSKFDKTSLGFTTELGSNWEIWQAYRELYTNCVIDEGGRVLHGKTEPPSQNTTMFRIFDEIETNEVFLMESGKKLILSSGNVDVYEGESKCLYYQGIRAKDLYDRPSIYTYNINYGCDLTEDRTLSYNFQVSRQIANAIAALNQSDHKIVNKIINADSEYYESDIDFTYAEIKPTEAFNEVVLNSKATTRNMTASQLVNRHIPAQIVIEKEDFLTAINNLCYEYDIEYTTEQNKIIINLEDLK